MKQAQNGDRVRVRYIGTLDNGRIFDSCEEAPLELTLGAGEVFSALEKGILGMTVGEARNITLTADEAFGPRTENNILQISRDQFPPNRALKVGEKLEVEFGGQKQKILRIAAFDDKTVTLDGNHPLAGLDLTFALQLDAILEV